MSTKLLVGLDGHSSGERALAYGEEMAKLIGACELLVVYVIEWSPYSFQTPEENAERHKRREEEISTAMERVVTPALARLNDAGLTATGLVRHGNVADTLNAVAVKEGATQIVVARSTESGLSKRIFGSSTANLVMEANVPVTVVG
ncbi:universal stress protein [Roseobacter sp. HKCCD9010]|jgi:nucleotide-binding universal stress UspA family protein|uniref:universal stress protein n=1 Tax=Rhodobacterales TaxID=204455 RepID=UPI00119A7BB5|nr:MULTISPECIES: universal stress protein [Rhodobacterales]MBF9048618.1 universal stress protein [Rhodobacterales bacterium HKCCD4356]NNV10617.1 universal stress protein [Roseobacter sp. HKCCD7357]NNV14802.1 universal stress protein [Roseobacter sp. HKCCD8768]NNV24261.1 universal stress protein [Roseobacter sp. HKCCD8192]NNV28518.1 universal stress protein [Roseobacter sp. HKCCD9061]